MRCCKVRDRTWAPHASNERVFVSAGGIGLTQKCATVSGWRWTVSGQDASLETSRRTNQALPGFPPESLPEDTGLVLKVVESVTRSIGVLATGT